LFQKLSVVVIYDESDPVQARLYRSLVLSVADINESVDTLFPKPPTIEVLNVTTDDSRLFDAVHDLAGRRGVNTVVGLSPTAMDLRSLITTGYFHAGIREAGPYFFDSGCSAASTCNLKHHLPTYR
jgi:hypothetical protein